MNYLSHFVFNHRVCGLPVEPYFVTGVALPDLWLRFSRQRRIRWRVVHQAEPASEPAERLRAGLLNHVDADQSFHVLPAFINWQRDVQDAVDAGGTHPAMVDFLAHVAVELALDHHLLLREPGLADDFYDLIAAADADRVEREMAALAGVDTRGLAAVLRGFVQRRFIRQYRTHRGLCDVVHIILMLAAFPPPPARIIQRLIAEAISRTEPLRVWESLTLRTRAAVPAPIIGK